MIDIIPAIDIIDGRCVRLTKGDYSSKKVYDASPVDMALAYADCGVGRIHMVDLDGAKVSSPANLRTLERVASKCGVEVEWGGGIASGEALRSVFDAGATQAIVGSIAARSPELFREWLLTFGGARMILGSDVRGRKVAVKGWLETTDLDIGEQIGWFLPDGLRSVICTDISRDGCLEGPSFELYKSLQQEFTEVEFTASGGISSMDDIYRLEDQGTPKVIVGKAIYEGHITLKDIEKCLQRG